MQNAAEEIEYLKVLLAICREEADPFLAAIIVQIHERLEVLKVCM
jgi:hypothetical protein